MSSVTLGLLLDQYNARSRKAPDPQVGVVLLERTMLDPPRAAAARRWGQQIRHQYPNAALIPYAWHLISHGPEDRIRLRTSRSLTGEAHQFGGLQDNQQTRQAWDVTRLCVEALETTQVILRTPPSITPGALGRARIRAFVTARRTEGIEIVWEPQGLWEPLIAHAFAEELGIPLILPAFAGGRPLHDDAGDGLAVPGAWLRVDGSGPRQGIHGGIIDDLLDHLDNAPITTMVFTGPRAHRHLAMMTDALEL